MQNTIEILAKEFQIYLNKKLKLECFQNSLEVAKSLGYLDESHWQSMENEERIKVMTDIYKNAIHTYKFISEDEVG